MIPAGQSPPGSRIEADEVTRQRKAEAESSSGEEESSEGGCICLAGRQPLPLLWALPPPQPRRHSSPPRPSGFARTCNLHSLASLANLAAAGAAESSSDEDQQPLAQRGWAAKHALPQPTAPPRKRHNRFPKIPKCEPACPPPRLPASPPTRRHSPPGIQTSVQHSSQHSSC